MTPIYRGPSLLTGTPIVVLLSHRTENAKLGEMSQAWVVLDRTHPTYAMRTGADKAVCGTCPLRGAKGQTRICYVRPYSPASIWRAWRRSRSRRDRLDLSPTALAEAGWGRRLRLTAYGDPAAVPYEVWTALTSRSAGWTGYTHHWKTCDPRLKTLVMASVETEADAALAQSMGWRTFRILSREAGVLQPNEVRCPASKEAGKRTTCSRCLLCNGSRGLADPRKSIAITVHAGMRAFTQLEARS